MIKYIYATLILTLICFLSFAQTLPSLKLPAPSQKAKISQGFGVSTIEIEYSRPSLKGRVPFVDIEKFGKKWRTGANKTTIFTFNMDVKIAGNTIKSGTYALYTIPGKTEWTVVFSKDIDNNGNMGGYKDADDVAKFTVKSQKLPVSIETFTIDIGDITDNSCMVSLMWGKHLVSFKVTTDTNKVAKEIIKEFNEKGMLKVADAKSNIADYYLRNKINLDEALEAIDYALEIKGRPFYLLLFKAEILYAMGKKKEAVKVAKEGLKKVEKLKNDYGYKNKIKMFIKKAQK